MFETVICRDVLEDIVDLSAVDYTKRHTTPSPEVVLVSYIYICSTLLIKRIPLPRGIKYHNQNPLPRGSGQLHIS